MATMTLCACGKRMGKYANTCVKCHRARMAACIAVAMAHVERGTCPSCGTALYRNLAILGWWQCGAYPSESMRAPEHKGKVACSFQCFTA